MDEEIMTKEQQTVSGEEKGQESDTVKDLISALNEIKQNTVPKETYDKLRKDNQMLMETIVNGQTQQTDVEQDINVDDLREELFGNKRRDLSNREYVEKMLELRKGLMKRGEQDPFVMKAGKMSSPEQGDFEKAERLANSLQECVDIADGNDDVFNNEFQRRLV